MSIDLSPIEPQAVRRPMAGAATRDPSHAFMHVPPLDLTSLLEKMKLLHILIYPFLSKYHAKPKYLKMSFLSIT
jgi:hypothetical protein